MKLRTLLPLSLLLALGGCSTSVHEPSSATTLVKPGDGKFDSSAEALFLDFSFSGELLASSSWNASKLIEDQLLFTVGHLNGDRSLGRLDRLDISNIETARVDGGYRVTYDAVIPVAWGKPESVPDTYTFTLPRDVSYSGKVGFTDKYKETCVDWSAHDVDSGVMWYYFRPEAYRCELDQEDVVSFTASVAPSAIQTNGKYPEYHRIWEDDVLRAVIVFGKNEDGATSNGDAGISAYNRFVRSLTDELEDHELSTTPTEVPTSPGVSEPDILFEATLPDGKKVHIVALLVDNVRTAGYAFDRRYEELSTNADLIIYNGHAGLGANIRALARKGRWIEGQYAIVFMNGCDTYAYVDSALADAHAAVNPDDAIGTKYVDIVMNAMPAFFSRIAEDSMAMVRGLLSHEDPQTYEQIFAGVDASQVVLVSGEEDNEFQPGGVEPPPPPGGWDGMDAGGSVSRGEEKRYETPVLDAGTYLFDMTGTSDADLYVRIGMEPTTRSYDCRPYYSGSNETCAIDLGSPAVIHVMVRGYASSSEFELVGYAER